MAAPGRRAARMSGGAELPRRFECADRLFAKNLQHPLRLLGLQAGVALRGDGAVPGAERARRSIREAQFGVTFSTQWWHFWRHWYPHLFFLFCFEELAHLMTLFTPDWQDAKLLAFDHWLTGVQPTIWLEQFATPLRNDGMQFFYLTYFTYLLILGGILYCRREWQAYWSVMTYSMVGYMCGYLIAMFFPIESPWFSMAGSWKAPLAGGPFTATINFIEHLEGSGCGVSFGARGGGHGGVVGRVEIPAMVVLGDAAVFFFMCVSTIWGRYHYVADIFGGMTTGTLGYVIGSRIMQWKGAVGDAAAKYLRTDVAQSIEFRGGLPREKIAQTGGRVPGASGSSVTAGDELQTDGQAACSEAAGNGDCGDTGKICRAVIRKRRARVGEGLH